MSFKISSASITNKGERNVNEDYLDYIVLPSGKMGFVVCDGLGGHGKGDIASKFVTECMMQYLGMNKSMEESIMNSQNLLLQKQKQEKAEDSMKTTITCLTIDGDKAKFGHVGDSRIYYFEKEKYKLRSIDHSIPQLLVNRGEIREKDIRHHEDRSKIIRVMGTPWNAPKYQIVDNIHISNRTTFLLCSDGFWELIDEKMMCKTLKKSATPMEWLQKMESIIWENGRGTGMDNYSAIAVFIR